MIPGAKDQALFLYGHDVNQFNNRIPFKISGGGSELIATLNEGNYTATEFMAEIVRALTTADGSNTYTVTLNRTVSANTENRMTVTTSGGYLDLLFGSGSTALSSPRILMGFDAVDYTGATSYTGTLTSGTILIPAYPTYNYHGPDVEKKSDGVKNVSAFGIKETLVFSQVGFFEGEWKWITDLDGSLQKTQWITFLEYATRQKKLEFTPSLTESAGTFYQCTLESTPEDSNGLAYKLKQMTGQGLWRVYMTGNYKFRVKQE